MSKVSFVSGAFTHTAILCVWRVPMYIRKEEAKSVAYDHESALCYPTNIRPGYRSFDFGAIRGWRLGTGEFDSQMSGIKI